MLKNLEEINSNENLKNLYFDLIDKSLNEVYVFKENNFRFVFVNKTAKKHLKYSKRELMKMTPLDLKMVKQTDKLKKIISQLKKKKKENILIETKIIRKDNTSYPVKALFSLYDTDSTAKKLIVAQIINLSEIKEVESKLKYSQLSYQTLFDSLYIGIYIINPANRKILQVNKRAAKQIEYKTEELVGNSINKIFHRSDLDLINQKIIELQEKGEISIKTQLVGKYNIPIIVELTIIESTQNRKKVFQLIVKDITKERKIENLYAKYKHDYHQLYDDNIAGFYKADMEYQIISCNNTFAQILGVKNKDEIINKKIKALFVDKKDRYPAKQKKIGDLNCYETKITLEDGRDIWILEHIKLIFDTERKPQYIEGAILDITDKINYRLELETENFEKKQYQSELLKYEFTNSFIAQLLTTFIPYSKDKEFNNSVDIKQYTNDLISNLLNINQKKNISCIDEIDIMESYLNLYQLVQPENIRFKIEISDTIDFNKTLIPPLLLLPYLENILLNTKKCVYQDILIIITLSQLDNIANYRIETFVTNGETKKVNKNKADNFSGFKSLIERIDLLNEIFYNDIQVKMTDKDDDTNIKIGSIFEISYTFS